jgi:replicative DNA helicase
VTAEVQGILDDLRTRFQFALVAEHHAPQGNNGSRELRPFGSSLWLRWPEFGLRFRAHPDRPKQVVLVERWRGDRYRANWPDELHRGPAWPWEGRWSNVADGRPLVNDPAF